MFINKSLALRLPTVVSGCSVNKTSGWVPPLIIVIIFKIFVWINSATVVGIVGPDTNCSAVILVSKSINTSAISAALSCVSAASKYKPAWILL